MADFKQIRTTQDTAVNASRRFVEPLWIPVYSINFPTTGDETPPWSPNKTVRILGGTISGYSANTTSPDPTVIFILKRNAMGGPFFILDLSLPNGTQSVTKLTEQDPTVDHFVTAADNLYCGVWHGGPHDSISVQLYGEYA